MLSKTHAVTSRSSGRLNLFQFSGSSKKTSWIFLYKSPLERDVVELLGALVGVDAHLRERLGRRLLGGRLGEDAVSYTHLTLPTNLRV